MQDSFVQIDRDFLEEFYQLCPEVGLLHGQSSNQDRWAQLGVTGQSMIDLLVQWRNRRESEAQSINNRQDKSLYHIAQHLLLNKKNLLEFEKENLQTSPECAENTLKILFEQALRSHDHIELADGLVTRFFSLSLALNKYNKVLRQSDEAHLRYAQIKAEEGIHFLDEIVESAPEEHIPVVAKEAAKRAFQDYIAHLNSLKSVSALAVLGEEKADRLLELRDVPYSAREMLDFSIDLVEEMRMERSRITHLYCNNESLAKTLRKTRAQHPYSTKEASSWLQELLGKSQSYISDTGIFKKTLQQPNIMQATIKSYDFLGQYAFIPSRSSQFNKSFIYLNSTPNDTGLQMLSVADLETIAAMQIEPGLARLYQTSLNASPLFSPHILGFTTPLSSYASSHITQAWSLYAMQWMREDGFRCSFASRFMTAYMLEKQAMYSIYDIEMMLGIKTPIQVAKSLEILLLMSPKDAEKLALELYSKPSMASSTLNNWLSINQLQDEARRVWRHDYNDKNFFDMLIGNGALAAPNLFQFLEDFKPKDADSKQSGSNQNQVFAKV